MEIFRSADELFHAAESDPSLFDAVLIATPHKTHKELAVRAFELKKMSYVISRRRQILVKHLQ